MRRRREQFCLMEGKIQLAVDSGVHDHYGEQRVRSHELILSGSCRLGPSILSLGLCLSLGLGPFVWVLPVSGSRRLGHSCLWVPSSGSLFSLGPASLWDLLYACRHSRRFRLKNETYCALMKYGWHVYRPRRNQTAISLSLCCRHPPAIFDPCYLSV